MQMLSQKSPTLSGQGQAQVSTPAAQEEREGKRLRRKQSNRDSARRSRLRKQAESESLNSRVDALQTENGQLRAENRQLRARLGLPPLEQQPEEVGALRPRMPLSRLCPDAQHP